MENQYDEQVKMICWNALSSASRDFLSGIGEPCGGDVSVIAIKECDDLSGAIAVLQFVAEYEASPEDETIVMSENEIIKQQSSIKCWRSLHFITPYSEFCSGADIVQTLQSVQLLSSISPPLEVATASSVVELEYTRCQIISFLLHFVYAKRVSNEVIISKKKKSAVLGLGAGTIPNFISQTFKEWINTAVEKERNVVAAAKKFFGFGNEGIVHSCALKWIDTMILRKITFDILILDVYSLEGESLPLSQPVLSNLLRILQTTHPVGILSCNLLNRCTPHALAVLESSFRHNFIYEAKGAPQTISFSCVSVEDDEFIEKPSLSEMISSVEQFCDIYPAVSRLQLDEIIKDVKGWREEE